MIATATGRRRPGGLALLGLSTAVILGFALAVSQPASGQEKPSTSQTTSYLLSISDMMIATIQPRHRRLWQAEQARNWAFADYELGNLHGAFRRLGEAHPTEHDISLPDMVASVTERPFDELKAAIQSKDDTKFAKAYTDLTDGCNSCHQAFNHGVIVIKVPSGVPFLDQDFTSAAP